MKIPISSIPYLLLLSFQILTISAQCLDDQRSLLMQLKNNLTFDSASSTKLINWDYSVPDCCNWAGVTCAGAADGRVIGIDLSHESISDGITNSSSLFGFQYLKNLNLGFNKFNSTQISSKFGDLTSLRNLNLSNAGFARQIPVEISHLVNLEILDLSTVYFPGVSSLKLENPDLGILIKNFKYLKHLHLDGVNISANGSQWCEAIGSSLPNLQVLSLSSCYLSGPIDSTISKLQSSLSVIRLDKNSLSSPVPRFLGNFTNLTTLGLSSCHLNGTFPKEIFQVSTLQMLDLSDNDVLVGSLSKFPPNGSLRSLVLKGTNFSGSLPDSMANLTRLVYLDLSSNGFSGSIPSFSMANLTQLVYLDLSSNGFSGSIPSFSMAKNLTHLDLSHNELNGSILSTNWEGLRNLVYVDLRYNVLEGNVPMAILALSLLEKLQLASNRFDGHIDEFANASSSLLDTLDLGSNKLEGSIPNWIFELSKLNILLLASNKFNGTIRLDRFQKLENLTKLELSDNNLSVIASGSTSTSSSFPKLSTLKLGSCNLGVFPDLMNQSKLNYLDLSDNNLTGEVPNWIWIPSLVSLNLSRNSLVALQEPYRMPNLFILDLHLNNLQGKIPIPPASASYVDYSSNRFSSSIPSTTVNYLRVTVSFSLANNNLTGQIPTSICNATFLQVIDFSNNSLSGTIPSCLLKMSMVLVVLNLRGNNLTGSIPADTLQPNCALRTLDLNGNSLEGTVPMDLANCTKLEVLDLGNNWIKDTFPCHFKNISSLRVLVLRHNYFFGNISCKAKDVPWPKLQIIDLASNNFNGPIPEGCIKNWKAMKDDEDGFGSTLKHLQFSSLKLSQLYYQDAITVTSKGLDMELVKILTVFTSVDFSCNNFSGPVPDAFGDLKALYVLNLSHNAFTGQIPSSIGNLQQLESLDLSRNKLVGDIPTQLASLNFLSFLNLSFNNLQGRIPTGTQLQTFTNASYVGNDGLCGPPLTKKCSNPPSAIPKSENMTPSNKFDWQFIATGLGFGVGSGIVVAPLTFWSKGRKWCDKRIDQILMAILPMLGLIYMGYEEGKKAEEKETHITYDEEELVDKEGRYCVFCSKLDCCMKRVIHDSNCRCYESPPTSFSSSSSSSSLLSS